eukprot:971370-Prymnesium_polylepis.1
MATPLQYRAERRVGAWARGRVGAWVRGRVGVWARGGGRPVAHSPPEPSSPHMSSGSGGSRSEPTTFCAFSPIPIEPMKPTPCEGTT